VVQKNNLIVFQLNKHEQYIRRENIFIYGVEEDNGDNDDGEKVLFSVADDLEIDLQPNDIQSVHRLGQKKRNKENPRPIITRFVTYKKRNEFLANKRNLKNIEGRQHAFACEHLAPLRAKTLFWYIYVLLHPKWQYILLKTTKKLITLTSPDDLFKHGIDIDYKEMGCGKTLGIKLYRIYTSFGEFWNQTLNSSDYLHFNNKLPKEKCIRKCVNFACWNVLTANN